MLGRTLAHIQPNAKDGVHCNLAILATLAGRVEASGLLSISLFMLFFCLKTELAGNFKSENLKEVFFKNCNTLFMLSES